MGVVGPKVDLSYDYEHLGDSTDVVAKLASGSHPFAKKLEQAKRPVVIVGSECLQVGTVSFLRFLIKKRVGTAVAAPFGHLVGLLVHPCLPYALFTL